MTTSTPDAVDALVGLFADAEALAAQFKDKCDAMPALFQAINDNGDAGLLISKSSSLRAKALGANIKAAIWEFHSDLTEAAKARGIDVPGIESGGGR